MSSPYKIRQLLDKLKQEGISENLIALSQLLEKDFPKPLSAENTGKNCIKCQFRMGNKRNKCPYCYEPVQPRVPYQKKRSRPQMENNDCHICVQPFDVLVRLECGCNFCNGCLKKRLITKKYCAKHRSIFSNKIIQENV